MPNDLAGITVPARAASSTDGVRLCLMHLAEEAEQLGLPITARLIAAAARSAGEEAFLDLGAVQSTTRPITAS